MSLCHLSFSLMYSWMTSTWSLEVFTFKDLLYFCIPYNFVWIALCQNIWPGMTYLDCRNNKLYCYSDSPRQVSRSVGIMVRRNNGMCPINVVNQMWCMIRLAIFTRYFFWAFLTFSGFSFACGKIRRIGQISQEQHKILIFVKYIKKLHEKLSI